VLAPLETRLSFYRSAGDFLFLSGRPPNFQCKCKDRQWLRDRIILIYSVCVSVLHAQLSGTDSADKTRENGH
jgi:hypothetical protein